MTGAAQVATPLQQAKCELMAFPWTPDVLAMCNLLAASAGALQDVKRTYDALAAKAPPAQQLPFNCLLMPELASIQDRACSYHPTASPPALAC
jgi:hypothetical protein